MPDTSSGPVEAPQLYLAFDFGTKRIGVAVGDSLTRTARPETTLRSHNNQPDWQGIETLIQRWEPNAAVVGIPYNHDGSEMPMTPRAARFARQLSGRFGLRVETANEHLTSAVAVNELSHPKHPVSSANKRADKDSMAACLILEQWLRETQ